MEAGLTLGQAMVALLAVPFAPICSRLTPGHFQQTHPTTLSRLTSLPCDSKGGAGLHQPSFTPLKLSSFL